MVLLNKLDIDFCIIKAALNQSIDAGTSGRAAHLSRMFLIHSKSFDIEI